MWYSVLWNVPNPQIWIVFESFFKHVNLINFVFIYRNDPKFSDRYAWANSADPDQTAPRLFAIPSASFGLITLW